MSRRIDRVNEVLRLEISQLLARQIKDPRLSGILTTITEVRTAPDLRNALVLVSVMGDQDAKQSALAGIQSASKFLRRELRDRVSLRYVPFLKFALDDSFENADRLLEIMNQIQDGQSDWNAEEFPTVGDVQVSPAPTNYG